MHQQTDHLRLLPRGRLANFVHRWPLCELAVFGSALTGEFGPSSDADFLVAFSRGSRPSPSDPANMETELDDIVARGVDLVEGVAADVSEDYIRRRHIPRNYEVVYVA